MGTLWLATIPITNAVVAQIFGVRYVATLFGIVFLMHQLGSFFGAWVGGMVFDLMGNYDLVWWISAWLGVTAALLHWPIDERQLPRMASSGIICTRSSARSFKDEGRRGRRLNQLM